MASSNLNLLASNVIDEFLKNLEKESPRPDQIQGKYDAHVSNCIHMAHDAFCKSLSDTYEEDEVAKKWYELQTHLYSLAFRKSFQAVFEDFKFAAQCSNPADVLRAHATTWKNSNPNNPLLVNLVEFLVVKELRFENYEEISQQMQHEFASLREKLLSLKSTEALTKTKTQELLRTLSKKISESNCSKKTKDSLGIILEKLYEGTNRLAEFVRECNKESYDNHDDGTGTEVTITVKPKISRSLKRSRDVSNASQDAHVSSEESGITNQISSRGLAVKRSRNSSSVATSVDMETEMKEDMNYEDGNVADSNIGAGTNELEPANAEQNLSKVSKLAEIRAREMEKVLRRGDFRVNSLKNRGKASSSKKK